MNDEDKKSSDELSALAGRIGEKADRKLKARSSNRPVWFGLGMMGLVGWSVVVPTLLGAAVGVWLDKSHPSALSWTLALMVAGLVIGCANAGYWVAQQNKAMQDQPEDTDE